jgi:thiol-disulfide isomerase/thioredoxin
MLQPISKRVWAILVGWLAPLFFLTGIAAQAPPTGAAAAKAGPALPTVSRIDQKRFAELIKSNGRPLLINFWATWCEPCRDEFPELVKIDAEYKGKIDFITISLDFEEEITEGVPKFLALMKATMPTYVLITPDETAAISMVSKEWSGGLPMTVLYKPDGSIAYFRQGVVRHNILQKEIDKILTPAISTVVNARPIVDLPLLRNLRTAEDGANDALRDIKEDKASVFVYGLMPSGVWDGIERAQKLYSFGVRGSGCFVPVEGEGYAMAYNRTVVDALVRKHGEKIRGLLSFANQ